MPTYIYRRKDGTTFEIDQRITEDALTTCPTTGQAVTRVITGGTGLIFKGSGFYQTDYVRNKNTNGDASKTEAGDKKEKDTPSETTSKDEKKETKETTPSSSKSDT